MDKKELFRKIKVLLERLKEYNKKQVLKLSAEETISLIDVMKDIAPYATIDTSCGTCVLGQLNVLLSYYEREYPKFLETLTEKERIEETKIKLSQEELMAKMWEGRKAQSKKLREERAKK